jgi:hypothetical protein
MNFKTIGKAQVLSGMGFKGKACQERINITGAPSGKGQLQSSSFSNSKPLDNPSVSLDILFLEIVEEAPTLTDQHQQSSARVMVFRVNLEMLGQVADPLAQNGDLYLR